MKRAYLIAKQVSAWPGEKPRVDYLGVWWRNPLSSACYPERGFYGPDWAIRYTNKREAQREARQHAGAYVVTV